MGPLDLLEPAALAASQEVGRRARAVGGRVLLVAAPARDLLAGVRVDAVELEVFGVAPDRAAALSAGLDVEVAVSPVPFDVAAQARAFTVDAVGVDPLDGEVLDPFDGRGDLSRRVLRVVDPHRFVGDGTAVLHGMQLVARFGLDPEPATLRWCAGLDGSSPVGERAFEEWSAMLLRGVHLAAGLDFLRDTGWLRSFPELAATVGVPQDPVWHPEGDVFVHTGHCLDEFAGERVGDDEEDLIVGLAVLCHDFGKPATTEFKEGRWRAHAHDVAGVAPTRSFLRRLAAEPIAEEVVPLVEAHLRPSQLHAAGSGRGAVRRLSRAVGGRLDRLVRVAAADARGRPPLVVERFEPGEWLLEMAAAEDPRPEGPEPLLRGRHLVDELGMSPGPAFGPLLDAALAAQLDGAFHDVAGAIEWARIRCRQEGGG